VKFHLDIAAKKVSPVWNTPYQDPTGQTEISSAPGTLWHGMGVRADGTGLIYVANRNNHRIEIFFDAGISYKYVANIGSKGEDAKQCQMMAPHALALSPDKKALYVADDGIFIKHGKEPVNKGLARVTKVKLGFEETLEVPLVVK
jgi:DNA-binding beta-propeller fold protein YncE